MGIGRGSAPVNPEGRSKPLPRKVSGRDDMSEKLRERIIEKIQFHGGQFRMLKPYSVEWKGKRFSDDDTGRLVERVLFWNDVLDHDAHGQEAPKGWFRLKTWDYLSLVETLRKHHVHYNIRDGYSSGASVVTFKEPE